MAAEDTVMDRDRMLGCSLRGEYCFDAVKDVLLDACIAQAEITAPIFFKEGIKKALWLYAWWEDGVLYVGTTGTTLEQALKDWGIK